MTDQKVAPLLEIEDLHAGYGHSQVLEGVSFSMEVEAVTIVGRNGMGKTTTVHSIMGITKPAGGAVEFDGKDMTGQPSYAMAQAGLGLVPEGRQVFPNLTVTENLVATSANRTGVA